MKRFDAVGYNISSNGIVSFYQFHDNHHNAQIEEIYTLKLGEFHIQLIRTEKEKKSSENSKKTTKGSKSKDSKVVDADFEDITNNKKDSAKEKKPDEGSTGTDAK